jgi:hypothetical protein
MSNIVKAIQKIYPNIQGGFVYWQTKQDGSPLDSPIDGLVWENTEYNKPTWEQIEEKLLDIDLQEAKDIKISQLKANRDQACEKDLISFQGNEIIDNGNGSFTTTTNLVDFAFRTKKSTVELTSPSNVIDSCLRGKTIRYSCEILNPSRKGYIEMTPTLAQSIEDHLIQRAETNIAYVNQLEDQIEAINIIEDVIVDGVVTVPGKTLQDCIDEINNIDITFS